MKCTSQRLLITFFTISMLYQAPTHCGFSSAFKAISTGIEIAGHVATGIDVAMNIANVGVTLWGSEKDRERMAKGLGITSIITSIARGDIESAQASAERIRGIGSTNPQYTPLSGDDLIDADIIAEPTVRPTTRSLGDINQMPSSEIESLRRDKRVITINDMKIAQFGILKNQLVFAARLPQNPNEQKLYELMNGVEILFQAVQNYSDTSKLNLICYRIIPGASPNQVRKKEFVTIILPKSELQKDFFFGTTHNELSIFHKEGNDIIKTPLIQKIIE